MLSSNFSNKVSFFWIFLDLLVSVNIHVIKTITSNLADAWYIFPLISWHFIMCRDLNWHRTLPLKKKRFSIFENSLKTSGTTTKILSCLKIPLTSMRFISSCETSSPGSRPRQFFPSLPTSRTGLLIPLKKLFYSQSWRVLLQFLL